MGSLSQKEVKELEEFGAKCARGLMAGFCKVELHRGDLNETQINELKELDLLTEEDIKEAKDMENRRKNMPKPEGTPAIDIARKIAFLDEKNLGDITTKKFIRKVKGYLLWSSPKIRSRGMVAFAPNVICVYDNYDEYDTYYYIPAVKILYPGAWSDDDYSSLFPPGLKGKNIGIIPGAGSARRVGSFNSAFHLARQQLDLIDSKWYDKPKEV